MKKPDDGSRRFFLKASSMLGLAAAFRPVTIGEAFSDSKSNTAQKKSTMKQISAAQTTDRTIIRPFQVSVSETELAELRRRINSTMWPDRETITDDPQVLICRLPVRFVRTRSKMDG